MSNILKTTLGAHLLASLTVEELTALAVAKAGGNSAKKPGRPKKAKSVIAAAPKEKTDVSVIRIETVEMDGEKYLAVRTGGYNHAFHGFCYHEVEVPRGYKWRNKKVNGQWVKFVPMADEELLFQGIGKSFPESVTIERD